MTLKRACYLVAHLSCAWWCGKTTAFHAMKPLRNRSCPNHKHSKIKGLTHFVPIYFRLVRVVGTEKILCFYILITYVPICLIFLYKINT